MWARVWIKSIFKAWIRALSGLSINFLAVWFGLALSADFFFFENVRRIFCIEALYWTWYCVFSFNRIVREGVGRI